MDDVRAVLDTIGSKGAALLGVSEGGPMSVLFAATYPERTSALVLYGTMAKFTASADYPLGFPAESLDQLVEAMIARWGRPDSPVISFLAPNLAGDERFREFWARFERGGREPRRVRRTHAHERRDRRAPRAADDPCPDTRASSRG
jgi:pimeloyl-ACP methyl ester carboxylesterase